MLSPEQDGCEGTEGPLWLHFVITGNIRMIELMIKNGADLSLSSEVWDNSKMRPFNALDVAIRRKDRRMADLLRRAGASPGIWGRPDTPCPVCGVTKWNCLTASLEVPLEVISEANRVPGMYRLEVKDIPLTCEPDCQVRNSAGLFRFEVRDASELAARVELLTRRAWNAVVTDSRLKEAEASIAELLEIYPQSVWGHQLRGQVAEARKRWDIAAREYDAALEILRRGDDTLYAQARPADVQDRIAGLRHMRQALKVKFPE